MTRASVLLAAPLLLGATYHVDVERGKDGDRCGAAPGAGACRTLGRVLKARDLQPGDTVRVAPGVYRERVEIGGDDGGTAGRPVVVEGFEGPVWFEGIEGSLDDAAFAPCSAIADCDADGTPDPPGSYAKVYRAEIGQRAVQGVVETRNWTPIRVDDTGVTNVVLDLARPIPYANAGGRRLDVKGLCRPADAPVGCVQLIAGSWHRAEPYLWVRPFQDGDPRRGDKDLEALRAGPGDAVVFVSGDGVTLRGIGCRYSQNRCIAVSGTDVTLEAVTVESVSGVGISIDAAADRAQVLGAEASHVWSRREFTLPGRKSGPCPAPFGPDCGWHNRAGGTAFKVDGSTRAEGIQGVRVQGLTAWNAWNVVSLESTVGSRFADVLAKNSPNHTLITSNNSKEDNCKDNVLDRVIAFNGQDSLFQSGCRGTVVCRSAVGAAFFTSPSGRAADGARILSTLASGIGFHGTSVRGHAADYNWLPAAKRCRKEPDDSVPCDSPEWRERYGFDRNSRSAPKVRLAGTQWPIENGLAASRLTRAAFMLPDDARDLIDRGSPDLDCDGVLEPQGDDACTAEHGCAGAAPDIGPMERASFGRPPDVPGKGKGKRKGER